MRPEQIDFIGFVKGFADPWAIVIDWGNHYETITASNNPSHPQGVFSSTEGNFTPGEEKEWEDLPKALQTFIQNYIEEVE